MIIDNEKLEKLINSEVQEIDTLYNCISSAVFIGEINSKNGNTYVIRLEIMPIESAEDEYDFIMVNSANNCISE